MPFVYLKGEHDANWWTETTVEAVVGILWQGIEPAPCLWAALSAEGCFHEPHNTSPLGGILRDDECLWSPLGQMHTLLGERLIACSLGDPCLRVSPSVCLSVCLFTLRIR